MQVMHNINNYVSCPLVFLYFAFLLYEMIQASTGITFHQ
jgi:hypothetical protein